MTSISQTNNSGSVQLKEQVILVEKPADIDVLIQKIYEQRREILFNEAESKEIGRKNLP